jgi:hypothetical protein
MDSDGTRFAAIAETTNFLHYFSYLPDHRQAGKVDYPLAEILLLVLLRFWRGRRRSATSDRPGRARNRSGIWRSGLPREGCDEAFPVAFLVPSRFFPVGVLGVPGPI